MVIEVCVVSCSLKHFALHPVTPIDDKYVLHCKGGPLVLGKPEGGH